MTWCHIVYYNWIWMQWFLITFNRGMHKIWPTGAFNLVRHAQKFVNFACFFHKKTTFLCSKIFQLGLLDMLKINYLVCYENRWRMGLYMDTPFPTPVKIYFLDIKYILEWKIISEWWRLSIFLVFELICFQLFSSLT